MFVMQNKTTEYEVKFFFLTLKIPSFKQIYVSIRVIFRLAGNVFGASVVGLTKHHLSIP